MAIFVTGSTGYLGSYVVAGLLSGYRDKLNLLVRAKTEQEARSTLAWPCLAARQRVRDSSRVPSENKVKTPFLAG